MRSYSVSLRLAFPLILVVACSSSSGPADGGSASDGGASRGGDGGQDPGSTPAGDCASITNVSDGPTADQDVPAGAKAIVCYYAQPSEGYCRKITDAATIAAYVGDKNKGGIGCGSAVILNSAECPTKNAVGKCDGNSIEAQRVYYRCTKFSDPKAHCEQIKGTFTAL